MKPPTCTSESRAARASAGASWCRDARTLARDTCRDGGLLGARAGQGAARSALRALRPFSVASVARVLPMLQLRRHLGAAHRARDPALLDHLSAQLPARVPDAL